MFILRTTTNPNASVDIAKKLIDLFLISKIIVLIFFEVLSSEQY